MKLPWPFHSRTSTKSSEMTLDQLIQRLEAVHQTMSGVAVTPENCMESPTVHAIVTAVSRRISISPVHVYQKKTSGNRTSKELLPSHPVERLLQAPNEWQDSASYWLDAASSLVRWGRYSAYKARGNTGPIRRLLPLHSGCVTPHQDEDWSVTYRVTFPNGGGNRELQPWEIHYVRGPARDFLCGDSPVNDVREAIALEIAAEKFGATFFGNGAMPFIVFKYMQGFTRGHDGNKQFIEKFREAFNNRGRFKAMLLPNGIEMADPVNVENDKAQFIQTRQYQRTVIAGAFGVPPHLVGDLSKGTFNNVEQQNISFIQAVVLPYVRMFESAMERDLLTIDDRRAGVIIRFNLEGALRADFKTRQEGLKIQREAGVISPNDWREHEGMNPISEEDGGDTYWQQGPSGQNGGDTGSGGATEEPPEEGEEDDDAAA
jgi:HK97 family phage portal protein